MGKPEVENFINSLKVNDNLAKIDNDILMTNMNIMLILEIRATLLTMIC